VDHGLAARANGQGGKDVAEHRPDRAVRRTVGENPGDLVPALDQARHWVFGEAVQVRGNLVQIKLVKLEVGQQGRRIECAPLGVAHAHVVAAAVVDASVREHARCHPDQRVELR
jgi:hypothetical protein